MRNLQNLSTGKRLVVLVMSLLIVITWLAVCLVLASYF